MGAAIAEFFMIIGPEVTPPTNMVELIPYLLQIFVGVFLVSAMFRVFGKIGDWVLNFRRW